MNEVILANLAKEYDVAVRRMTVQYTDNCTEAQKEKDKTSRLVFLPCNHAIDFQSYMTTGIGNGVKRIVSPDHFVSNKVIDEVMCLNRCKFLHLSNPEKYISFAFKELTKDRNFTEEYLKGIFEDIITLEAEYRSLTWGYPAIAVNSSQHLGKSLSEVSLLAEAKIHWEICYQVFQQLPKKWKTVMSMAAMMVAGVQYDPNAMANRGRYKTCFEKQVSNTLNDIRCKVRLFGSRGKHGIVVRLGGPGYATAKEIAAAKMANLDEEEGVGSNSLESNNVIIVAKSAPKVRLTCYFDC